MSRDMWTWEIRIDRQRTERERDKDSRSGRRGRTERKLFQCQQDLFSQVGIRPIQLRKSIFSFCVEPKIWRHANSKVFTVTDATRDYLEDLQKFWLCVKSFFAWDPIFGSSFGFFFFLKKIIESFSSLERLVFQTEKFFLWSLKNLIEIFRSKRSLSVHILNDRPKTILMLFLP